jgi:hypothetical protein
MFNGVPVAATANPRKSVDMDLSAAASLGRSISRICEKDKTWEKTRDD